MTRNELERRSWGRMDGGETCPTGVEASPKLVRLLTREVKKAKIFQTRKAIRQVKNSEDALVLQACKGIDHQEIVKDIVLGEVGALFPKSVELEWKRVRQVLEKEGGINDAKELGVHGDDGNDQGKCLAMKEEIVKKIRQSKGVVQATESVRAMVKAWKWDRKAKRQRESRNPEDRPFLCGIGDCSARFATEDDRRSHRIRRHPESVDLDAEDDLNIEKKEKFIDEGQYIETNPLAELERTKKKKKRNRMGQRERRRLGIIREAQERRGAMEKGEKTLPPPSRGKHSRKPLNPSRSRSKKAPEARGNDEIKQSDDDLHPSWTAKRKQQDASKHDFQGKRIKFNDDDDDDE